jgi:hypothetical protein
MGSGSQSDEASIPRVTPREMQSATTILLFCAHWRAQMAQTTERTIPLAGQGAGKLTGNAQTVEMAGRQLKFSLISNEERACDQ